MTPKEEARQLVDKFSVLKINDGTGRIWKQANNQEVAKQCALICVDKITFELKRLTPQRLDIEDYYFINKYWKEVKQEINKLDNG